MKLDLHSIATTCMMVAVIVFTSCSDDEAINNPTIPEQPEQLTELTAQYNTNIAAYQAMMNGKAEIVDYTSDEKGNYKLQLSNRQIADVYIQTADDKDIPLLGIDKEGYWNYQLEGTSRMLTDTHGNPAPALNKTGKGILTPQIALGEDGCWQVSYNGYQWQRLSDTPAPSLEGKTAVDFSLYRSAVLDEQTNTIILESRTSGSVLKLDTRNNGTAQAWKKFLMNSDDNVLLDYSYAGYKHGEVTPPEAFSLGYKVFNVKERMETRGMTAREALISILQENNMTRKDGKNYNNANARIVIYFPEGEYVLHNDDDNTIEPGKPVLGKEGDEAYSLDSKGNNKSSSIYIFAGHFVIKGDGAGRTKLIMDTPNLPDDITTMYSSPVMIDIKHNSGLSKLCDVTGNAAKGTFSVEVSDAASLSKGDWVCLYLQNNDPELVRNELSPYAPEPTMENIINVGVQVQDFHQIVAKSGNVITFKEPIMHEVDSRWGWAIHKYPHYEEVGIEDVTFVGHATDDFQHHRNWAHDGAYKPIKMTRLTNSWMRRVNFISVSEANSITSSANVSAYDIKIDGNRGHAAIRSQGSSRVFIGKVTDRTNGPLIDNRGVIQQGAGQYHACGVSKPSMGAVIWRVHWGLDACFESHATQPRATLIDNCTGGFMQYRQGGDYNQLPNHLDDLTIWNMYSERSRTASGNSAPAGVFDWWRIGFKGWKFLPPVIVGFHGEPLNFVQEQVKLDESNGTPVEPQSLYEAQLEKRLGFVPAWLKALK